eukprot:UN27118
MHHTVDMFFDSNRRTKCLKQIVNNFPAHNKIPEDFYKDENKIELSGPRMYKKCRSKSRLFLKFQKFFVRHGDRSHGKSASRLSKNCQS